MFVGMGLGNFVLIIEEKDAKGLARDEFKFCGLVGERVDWLWRGFSSLPGLVFFCRIVVAFMFFWALWIRQDLTSKVFDF
jgi:hypothetical protein